MEAVHTTDTLSKEQQNIAHLTANNGVEKSLAGAE
jgi:hypothetical protein